MEFKKYNSVENSYQEKFVDQIVLQGLHEGIYVVQEKIHGANFSFYCNGETVKIAKRTGFIEEGEQFYNADLVLSKYKGKVMDLLKHVQNKYEFVNYIILYGELFGGVYNHQDVTPENTAIRVQKGIHYAPYNDFYAFDIALNGETYLNVHECNQFLDEMGFLYSKSLFEGTFEEALRYPNDQNSILPSWLGLPELESNISEGVIIKPLEVKYFRNGSRVVLKNKNEKWSEKSKIRKAETIVQEHSFSKEVMQILSILDCYITQNRWDAVVSKEGMFDVKFLGKYMGLFAKDILEDFYKEHLEDFNQLEKEDQKKVTKQLQTLISKFMKKEILLHQK